MMTERTAWYLCLKCNHEWSGKPGMVDCPRCGHHYVKWVNYEKDFERKEDDRGKTSP